MRPDREDHQKGVQMDDGCFTDNGRGREEESQSGWESESTRPSQHDRTKKRFPFFESAGFSFLHKRSVQKALHS